MATRTPLEVKRRAWQVIRMNSLVNQLLRTVEDVHLLTDAEIRSVLANKSDLAGVRAMVAHLRAALAR